MYRQIIGLIALASLLCSPAVKSRINPVSTNPPWLNQHPDINIGLVVQRLDTGKILYTNNSLKFYTPASLAKLFTATAALKLLGPDFRFKTTLFVQTNTRQTSQTKTADSVLLHFSGDPSFTSKDLADLIAQLKTQGYDSISGDFYIDDNQFDGKDYGPGWMWDELNLCYAAPINSIIIDENCLKATVTPNRQLGLPAVVTLHQPAQNLIRIFNDTQTVAPASSTHEKDCLLDLKTSLSSSNHYLLQGCVTQHPVQTGHTQSPLTLHIALKSPRHYSRRLIQHFLNQDHIKLHGHIFFTAPVNTPYEAIATHCSPKLHTLIFKMLKESNNIIAAALQKTLGAQYFHQAGNWKNGAKAIAMLLGLYDLNTSNDANEDTTLLKDGTGLSRYDLLTPKSINKLLADIYHAPQLYKWIEPSLPISGTDGTLENRMQNRQLLGIVHAKTGSMSHVSGLAGYLSSHSYKPLSFVIMVNGFTQTTKEIQDLEDRICAWLKAL